MVNVSTTKKKLDRRKNTKNFVPVIIRFCFPSSFSSFFFGHSLEHNWALLKSIICPHAITTKTWMKAECKRLFYKAWKAELPDSQLSMKFPTNFTSYKWTETRALARVFCGRSPTDSGPYKSPSQYEECNTDASSKHYLTTCPRFKRARKQLGKAFNIPITPQICLGHTTPLKPVIGFLRKTGLRFSNTLNFEDGSQNQQTILDREGTEDTGESEEDGNSDLDLSA
jgi:hypothetical protein